MQPDHPDRVVAAGEVGCELDAAGIVQQRYFLNWKSSCYSLQFEIRQSSLFQLADRNLGDDFEYYVAFTLKNVGTFIDFDGRID